VSPSPRWKVKAQAAASHGGIFSEPQLDLVAAIIAETQTLAETQLRNAITALR
jgi:hypothetical protein